MLALRFGFTVLGHYFPLTSETGQRYCSYLTCRFSFVKTFFFMSLMQIFSNSGHRSQLLLRNNFSSSHLCTNWLYNHCIAMRKSHPIRLHKTESTE